MNAKTWTQVTAFLPGTPEDWAVWHEPFEQHGIPGTVQTDQPPTMSGYAYEPEPTTLQALISQLESLGASKVEVEEVVEEDWAEAWKQYFEPRRVGERVVIRPTWREYPSETGDAVIVLDPGQAFGTGDHPTTRMCLELMQRVDLVGKSIADVGCGSGILAVGAKLLGAGPVVANDIEAASVESAQENAERNGVEYDVRLGAGFDPYGPEETFEIVLSNIISAALIQLAPSCARRVRPGGDWIVSGVIEANWMDVREAAEKAGFVYVHHLEENGWIAAHFRR